MSAGPLIWECSPLCLEQSSKANQNVYVKMESERRNIHTCTSFEIIPSYFCFKIYIYIYICSFTLEKLFLPQNRTYTYCPAMFTLKKIHDSVVTTRAGGFDLLTLFPSFLYGSSSTQIRKSGVEIPAGCWVAIYTFGSGVSCVFLTSQSFLSSAHLETREEWNGSAHC